MSTRANITVWGREFYQSSDGYPSQVVEKYLTNTARIWRRTDFQEGIKDRILLDYYENYEQGSGSTVDYGYDITDQDGEIIVIVSGHNLEDYEWEKECPSWEVISELHPDCDSVKLKLRSAE